MTDKSITENRYSLKTVSVGSIVLDGEYTIDELLVIIEKMRLSNARIHAIAQLTVDEANEKA